MKIKNNRKRTRGRRIYYSNINSVKVKTKTGGSKEEIAKIDRAEKDKGFILHESIKHLKYVNPILGNKVYVKEGKGKDIDFIITIKKTDIIKRNIKTVRHYER